MRNEDFDRELLACVTLVCAVIAFVFGMFEPSPSIARSAPKVAVMAEKPDMTPVRVVGVPFVPNTDPRQR